MSQARSPDPLYAGPRQSRPSISNGAGARPNGVTTMDSGTIQTLAEKFEDEKRRIIESCFSKREEDGSLAESYITHVRVVEDAMYPSSPPPPDSVAQNKKNRAVLVSVRKSGRVRVHKARENTSGSFSIGKTWMLDDLTGIQNFVGLTPANAHEQQAKQWASNLGFIVTLGKPYYWQASTSKEKDFFIASLIKIFRKYTGGRLPDLVGFSSQEIQQFTGSPTSRGPSGNQSQSQVSPPATTALSTPSTPERNRNMNDTRPAERVIADRQPRLPTMTQPNDSRPGTRDGQQPPIVDSVQSPPPVEMPAPQKGDFRSWSRENFKPQPLQQRTHVSRPSQDGSLAISNRSQASTPRPSISPRSSHSSLQPDHPTSHSQNYKTSALQPPPIPNEAGLRKLGVAPSVDSLRSGDTSSLATSRPSTATSDQRQLPVLAGERPPENVVQPRPKTPASRPEINIDRRSVHGEVTTPREEKSSILENTGNYVGPSAEQDDTPQFNRQEPAQTAPPVVIADRSPQETAPAAEPLTSEPETVGEDEKAEDEHRPGLGPMMKKKSAKEMFRKAAFAATAFQPRQGGAGARFRALQETKTNEPDGITSVVPAPLLRGMSTDSAKSGAVDVATPSSEKDRPFSPALPSTPKVYLQRKATEDSIASSQVLPAKKIEPPEQASVPERAKDRSPERRRRQHQEAEIEKYCLALGLEPRIVDGQGADFTELLSEFGWDGKLGEQRRLDDFEADIRREVGRAQATGWLGHIEQQDGKLQDLSKAFDKAIEECEEMDGLLTLYAHELDTLYDDIQYIEAQSQGLQVQTANQKLLQKELHSLLRTLNVSPADLKGVHSASMDNADGIAAIEHSLSILYQAMVTIDPELRQNRLRQADQSPRGRSDVGVYSDPELGQMRAVREKKEDYREETLAFLRRFSQYLTHCFKLAEQRTSEDNSRSSASNSTSSLSLKGHTNFRQDIWVYNSILLFVREVNTYEWNLLINSYEINIKGTYQDQFNENANSGKKIARKAAPEEQEFLFTNTEKEEKHESSLASTAARKLTVKRGKTVKAHALRQALRENRDGKLYPWDLFDRVLQDQAKAVSEEQNFIVHFFHLNSQDNVDFTELVSSKAPNQRRLPNLSAKQSYDPDRNLSKMVQTTIEAIYSFWPDDLLRLLDWCLASDPIQGIGILCAIERCLSTYEETNQEFITRILRQLHDKVTALFHKFIEEQVKAIEETKVKVNKRKGIIPFIRIFPLFSAAVEAMIPSPVDPNSTYHESLEVRFIVNDSYTKILKAIWESLSVIAKDSPPGPTSTNAPTAGDPEDKEALNYHILLIENMNHFTEEVDASGDAHHNVVLEEWREKASHDFFVHLTAYVDAVIRRPLGKWLDFLESTEAALKASDNSSATVAAKPSHSRSAAKKVLGAYDSKEVRKGVDTLKKRVEKHFADVDDGTGEVLGHAGQNKGLVSRVFEECASRYGHAWDRMKVVVDRVYGGELEIEWRKEEVGALFRR